MGCMRWAGYGSNKDAAEIVVSEGRASFTGVFRCKGQWACDCCSRRHTESARSWLRGCLFPALEAKGLTGSMATFTIPHRRSDNWGEVVSALKIAWQKTDRRLGKLWKRIGSVGKFKALEVKVGKNGIHPHLHVFISHQFGADTDEIQRQIGQVWVSACLELGREVSAHGFDWQSNCLSDYVAKGDCSLDLSGTNSSELQQHGLTLGQLLDKANLGDREAAEDWIRAIAALQGTHRFHSGGLAKKLGLDPRAEWEDPFVLAKIEASKHQKKVLISYPRLSHQKATLHNHGRPALALILRSARSGREAPVLEMVAALCRATDRALERKALLASTTKSELADVMTNAGLGPLKTMRERELYLLIKRRPTHLRRSGMALRL